MRAASATWWASLLAAGMALSQIGCGSGDSSDAAGGEVAEAGSADMGVPPQGPPPSAAPAEAPAPETQTTEAPAPAPVGGSATPAPAEESTATTEATTPTPEPTATPASGATPANAAATGEILQLAMNETKNQAPAAESASTTVVDSSAGQSGATVQTPGGSSGGEASRPAGYPAPSGAGGQSSAPPGYPAPGGSSSGGTSYEQQMQNSSGGMSSGGQSSAPAGYPAPGGGSSGGSSSYEQQMRRSSGMQQPAAGYPGASGGVASEPGAPGGSGSAPRALTKDLDFSNPVKGAESFLAAAATGDIELIAQSVAIRSTQEAVPKHQTLFRSILERSTAPEEIAKISDVFKDMKVMGTNQVKSTAMLGVIVGRTEDNGDMTTWTLEMRKEKAGWKLRDVNGPRIRKGNAMARQGRNAGGYGGADSGASSSGSDSGGLNASQPGGESSVSSSDSSSSASPDTSGGSSSSGETSISDSSQSQP